MAEAPRIGRRARAALLVAAAGPAEAPPTDPALRDGGLRGIDWKAQPGLGVDSDGKVGRALGVSQPAVSQARKRLGIAPAPQYRRWAQKGIDWAQQPLGRFRDPVLAQKLGVTRAAVRAARLAYHVPTPIPRSRIRRAPRTTPRITSRGIDWDAQPLDTVPGVVLAEQLGCSRQALNQALWRRVKKACLKIRQSLCWLYRY